MPPPPPQDDLRLSNTTGILRKTLRYHLMCFQQFTLCYCLVKSFFFVSTFKSCFCHQSVMPFLSGAPPAKKNPASPLA